jgi:CRISPR-associated protein Cas2
MADLVARLHILSYDIADPKRLIRVHRTLRRWGIPLQYSVFLIRVNKPALQRLKDELDDLIERRRDDIRIYPLPTRLDLTHYGRQLLPTGIELFGRDLYNDLIPGLAALGDPSTRRRLKSSPQGS